MPQACGNPRAQRLGGRKVGQSGSAWRKPAHCAVLRVDSRVSLNALRTIDSASAPTCARFCFRIVMSQNIVIIGAGQAGVAGRRQPAGRGLCRRHHHGRRRAVRALSAPAAVQGLSDGHVRARPAVPQARRLLSRSGLRADPGRRRAAPSTARRRRWRSSDGRTLPYDKLLLATGTRVRQIKCPGADLAGIHYLRSIADVDGLQAGVRAGQAAGHRRRRLYRAGSRRGRRQARPGRDGVRGAGPGDGARGVEAGLRFLRAGRTARRA